MQPDLLENLLFPLLAFLVAAQVHKIQRVLHDLAHAHTRVERGVRVLKDDLVLGAQSLEPILRDAHKLVALQPDGTARDAHQPHDSLGYGCLPGTAFAHDAERGALAHAERHAVHSLHVGTFPKQRLFRERKVNLQVPDLKEALIFSAHGSPFGKRCSLHGPTSAVEPAGHFMSIAFAGGLCSMHSGFPHGQRS